MSNVTGTVRAIPVDVVNPKIYNYSVTSANTEYTQTLSANTRRFMIRVRGEAEIKLAYTTGESGTKYITIPKGCSYEESGILFTGSLFFQCNKDTQVVEILEWT